MSATFSPDQLDPTIMELSAREEQGFVDPDRADARQTEYARVYGITESVIEPVAEPDAENPTDGRLISASEQYELTAPYRRGRAEAKRYKEIRDNLVTQGYDPADDIERDDYPYQMGR